MAAKILSAPLSQVQCYHCGEDCDAEAVRAEGKTFCCNGCKTVYELLQENGLCTYYDIDSHAGISFKKSTAARFEYLDDESVIRQLVQFNDGSIAKLTLSLPQIHCTSCVWLLEHLYKINPAILRSEVNFLKKELSLTYRPADVSLREVVALLAKLGYEPDIRLANLNNTKKTTSNAMKSLYYKVGVAGFAFGNVMLFSVPDYLAGAGGAVLDPTFRLVFELLSIALAIPVLVYSASEYFVNSWYSIRERAMSLDVPVALGISALFVRSIVDISLGWGTGYLDSFTGLVFFLLIGKIFQRKTFETLSFDRDYTSYFPLSVTRVLHGVQQSMPLSKLEIGDTIFVRNRELIPADCILISDNACIDYSFVSGEAEPVEVLRGATIYAGGRVAGAGAEFVVSKEVSHSYLTQLWNDSIFSKEKRTSLVDISNTFGKYFTIIVALIAFATALFWLPDMTKALNTFTAVLIVACPCALTLAAPFTLGAAVTILGKAKFYLKNVGVVPDVASLNAIVFDKTGTLTHAGEAQVDFEGEPLMPQEQQALIAGLQHSSHPLSRQILGFVQSSMNARVNVAGEAQLFNELAGSGVEWMYEGHYFRAGSAMWVNQATNNTTTENKERSEVHLSIDATYRGRFRVGNRYRQGVEELVQSLGKENELYVLSGDNDSERPVLEEYFDANHLAFHQKPDDKLQFIRQLEQQHKRVAMIGDGINDAGALRQSSVGIALTEDAAAFTPACDAILSADTINRLPEFIAFAQYAITVLKIAFWVSVVYNAIGLALACSGKLTPMVAAIFMPLSSWSVVGIAYGLMKLKEPSLLKTSAGGTAWK